MMQLPELTPEIPIEVVPRPPKFHPYFKQLMGIVTVLVLSIGLGIGVKLSQSRQNVTSKAVVDGTVKVMVLDFHPDDIRNRYHWNDPVTLENQYISDVTNVSGGKVKYQIAQRQTINDYPAKEDGFDYTTDSYKTCWETNRSSCHQLDWANYLKILNDYDVCGRVNRNEIDELWLWGGPYFGYYEAIMTGPGAFWTNGGPLTGSSCQRKLNIMGFNYERGVSEMLEDLGHRVEGTMKQVYGSWTARDFSHDWNKFTALEKDSPGKAGCGNVHYGPNSTSDYEWNNPRAVASNCEDWLNYPNLTGATQSFGCERWECDGYKYLKWWLNHLPSSWWKYIAGYDQVSVVPSPTPYVGPPNSCGGTCGSHNNCQAGLFCYQGFCRNPLCKETKDCKCTASAPTPKPTTTVVKLTPAPSPSPTASANPVKIYNLDLQSPSAVPTPAPTPPPSFWENFFKFFLRLFGIKY